MTKQTEYNKWPTWEKCWKINCTPAMEVYESHIHFYGTNLEIEQIDGAIKHHESHAKVLREAKEIWEREFKKSSKK